MYMVGGQGRVQRSRRMDSANYWAGQRKKHRKPERMDVISQVVPTESEEDKRIRWLANIVQMVIVALVTGLNTYVFWMWLTCRI